MKNNDIKNRALEEARFVIDTHSTVRETAKIFGISKSSVHKDLTERLPNYSPLLADQASAVIQQNKEERAIRGGIATKRKYLALRNTK